MSELAKCVGAEKKGSIFQSPYLKCCLQHDPFAGFQSQETLPSDRVATAAARPHLHRASPSLPAQKGTIQQPTKQMRFPYIRRQRNHISRVVSFPSVPRPVPN